MNTDIDETIRAALHDRAGGDVHVEGLLAGATRQGRRRRRIHHAMVAGGTAMAVLAVGGVLSALPWGAGVAPGVDTATQPSAQVTGPSAPSPGGPGGSPSAQPSEVAAVGAFRPPTADAKPLAQGGRVGTGQLLHLDAADPAAVRMTWSTGQRHESLTVVRMSAAATFSRYEVLAADTEQGLAAARRGEALPPPVSTDQVTFGGKPATLRLSDRVPGRQSSGSLTWQPTPGTWAQVVVYLDDRPQAGRTEVLAVAGLVRFDRVFRCVVGFRLAWTPSGTRLTDCSFEAVGRPGRVATYSGVRLVTGKAWWWVNNHDRADLDTSGPFVEVEGRRIQSDKNAAGYAYSGTQAASLSPGKPSISQADANRVMGHFVPVPGDFPQAWVQDPLH
ncbi:hypothetical protein [Catellatospora sichuanensis]|uniref:hypothetical protein n=1 Tax=Catellatospora sichuanensis TaxID=1969805 RepID=UPI00118306B4|nr:hypothetical protein [Catellatospora sichuanensis]